MIHGSLLSWNIYTICENNPVFRLDKSGNKIVRKSAIRPFGFSLGKGAYHGNVQSEVQPGNEGADGQK